MSLGSVSGRKPFHPLRDNSQLIRQNSRIEKRIVTMADTPESDLSKDVSLRSAMIWLSAIVVAYLAFRVPIMLHEPARLDEHYAVPGWTITKTGLPQLPHLPCRDPSKVYYRADEVLYAEPPLYFYVQAVCFLLLPDTIGAARVPSLLSGVGVLILLFALTSAWTGSRRAGLWATATFSLSRWFIYGVTLSRGDLLCTFLGLAAVWTTWRWTRSRHAGWLIGSGVLIGLGGLTHPFAIVYAAQIGAWVVFESRGWKRLGNFLLVTIVSLLVFALWIPLILVDSELFRIQFLNQIGLAGDNAADAWLLRLPRTLWFHGQFLWRNLGIWQFLVPLVVLCLATGAVLQKKIHNLRTAIALAWSSIVLMCFCTGLHHPVPGYWSYPGALIFIGLGWGIASFFDALQHAGPSMRWVAWPAGLLIIASLLPGSSVRILVAMVQHWGDPNYSAPAFARIVMERVPEHTRCTVDGEFVLDFLVAGRPTLGIPTEMEYFDAENHPYDYLIVSRYSERFGVGEAYCGVWKEALGIHADPFACYAEIFVPTEKPCTPRPRMTLK
jgi:4-amino-4-deoxy-L-arabinose transferase-like glycosyltransferase